MSHSKKKQDQPSSSLSSIVSNLVRAAIGGKHHDVPDGDLDKYVAEMIMKSANVAQQKSQAIGHAAYYFPDGSSDASSAVDKARLASGVVIDRTDSNGLKTNKRFLSSIIKNTDEHNQALIRAEEKKAAEMAKELIADLDRRAVKRERSLYGKVSKRDESFVGRMRMDEIESRSSSRSGSASPAKKRARSRSNSPPSVAKGEVKIRGRGVKKYDTHLASSSSVGSRLGSKMDKYFEEGYDPLLDTHSGDEAVTQTKQKKSRKDRSRRKHKKHKSEKSSKSSRHGSDSGDDEEREASKRRRMERHDSGSKRRRKHSGDVSDDERSTSRSSRNKSEHEQKSRRTPGRSPSPKRSRRHKDSRSSRGISREEKGSRDKHSSTRRRGRDSSSNDVESDIETRSRREGSRSVSRSRSRSRSHSRTRTRTSPPPTPLPPKPAPREWDLHKINKNIVRSHLLNINRTETS
ncbi:hypothetical protein BGZ65_004836 [Modicella reniformis]|uniref:Uncharacterized protein n=1 Tax=Modicella reniformis TaxID=1440133 RepID=A0A9P6J5M4_9FUNG|nr:hypothetical protein BGZ65_004836 [Modicella reniformis]